MKFLRRILAVILICFIGTFFLTTCIKKITTASKISSFKRECSLVESISTDKKKFYNVSRETYEPSLSYKNKIINPGSFCDIIVKTEASYTIPVLTELQSFFIGGHAALCTTTYTDSDYDMDDYGLIETAFNEDTSVCFYSDKSYWEDVTFTKSYMVLRVQLTEEEKNLIFKEAIATLGSKYNLSFIFDTENKHYCSDLISYIFNKANINLNFDGLITTIYDIICSKNTEIVMYKNYDVSTGVSSYYGVNIEY